MSFIQYKQSKQRSIQPILTRTQIRDLGKMIGISSFRQSVEYFMDPVNYFKLSKVKMDEMHRYLLEKGVTYEKCPHAHHTHQHDRSRQLISILFPGYPVIQANDRYYRQMRENKSQAKIISLAYDLLPTTDRYERLEEMFRAPVDWKTGPYQVSIPLRLLNRARVVEGHASSELNVRLFLHFWSSERVPWHPGSLTRIAVDDAWQPLTGPDRDTLDYGFFHLDLTDKSDGVAQANRRTPGDLVLTFEFSEPPRTRHVSVCTVWEKSEREMVSQTYTQTASLYISQAMERASRKPAEVEAVQKQVVAALKEAGTSRSELGKKEALLAYCAKEFREAWDSQHVPSAGAELIAGDEYVSVIDPILLSPVQHPTRCTFCTHNACFDGLVFFRFQSTFMQWKCPICNIKIRGIQDLYIDCQLKQAIQTYPGHDRLLKQGNTFTLPDQTFLPLEQPKRLYEVISVDDEPVKKIQKI